ncbi:MAG: hypothetical protein BroJett005_24650 [Ignavibacteriota bacterium]|nr:MAG: hypothetical protein BroJett005_24650 [Ignavibacteriota bacterium]
MAKCVICNSEAVIDNTNVHDPKIACSSCGKFSITDVAVNVIPKNVDPNWNTKLQNWIRMNQIDGYVPITTSVVKSIF